MGLLALVVVDGLLSRSLLLDLRHVARIGETVLLSLVAGSLTCSMVHFWTVVASDITDW